MLEVAVLTRQGSGRAINQDRVVVNDTVVDSEHPTTVMFTVWSCLAFLDGLMVPRFWRHRLGLTLGSAACS